MAVNGIDVSKWQGEIDWQKAKSAGAQFAFIRAGSIDNLSGSCYEDTQFRRNAELAPPLMPVGFYWYFRPNWNALTQADYFCDLIQDKAGKLYPVIDVEEHGSLNKTAVASAVWSFTNRVFQRLGVRPMIYTSPGFWNARVARNTWAQDFPLWVAHWNTSTPTLPDDWKNYAVPYRFWQTYVGQDGPDYGMQSKGLDHDVYNGEWEQFAREFKLGEPGPEPEPETMWVDDFVIEKVYPLMVEHWGYTGPRPVKRP
jgi:lysozyme